MCLLQKLKMYSPDFDLFLYSPCPAHSPAPQTPDLCWPLLLENAGGKYRQKYVLFYKARCLFNVNIEFNLTCVTQTFASPPTSFDSPASYWFYIQVRISFNIRNRGQVYSFSLSLSLSLLLSLSLSLFLSLSFSLSLSLSLSLSFKCTGVWKGWCFLNYFYYLFNFYSQYFSLLSSFHLFLLYFPPSKRSN